MISGKIPSHFASSVSRSRSTWCVRSKRTSSPFLTYFVSFPGRPRFSCRNFGVLCSFTSTVIQAPTLNSCRIASTASTTFAFKRYRVRGEPSFWRSASSRSTARFSRASRACEVQLGLASTVVPDQPVALGALTRRLADRELVEEVSVVVALVVDRPPIDLSPHDPGAEGGVFTSGAGEHAEEPSAMPVDVGHVLGGGQLAIRDVEEVVSPGQLAEQVPGGDVGAVIGGVAALDPEVHRHGTVAADGEDVEQLLEVGAVILVVAPGDRQAKLSPQGALPVGVLVVAVERHGRGVVVQLIERDVEGR